MVLKAIETTYNGYRFRSRLESRWAVFLDRMKVAYDYEPEGFDLGDVPPTEQNPIVLEGRDAWYLPDFWLPKQQSWMEVKPTKPTEIEQERCRRLALASKQDVVIVVGQPWIAANETGYDGTDSGYMFAADGYWDNYYVLTACAFCGTVAWCFSGWADRLPCECPNNRKGVGDYSRVERAYEAARRARFEYGETPKAGD